ncbi:MAG TPA: HAMP domain-containing sensor histidine kinase [Solirubrobacteraceae bacterium]
MGTIAVVVAVLTLGFNLVLSGRLDRQASNLAQDRATAELSALSVGARGVRLSETPDGAAIDTPIWVFSDHRALERPLASAAVQRAAEALSTGPRRLADTPDGYTRLDAVPILYGRRRMGTVVAAVSLRSAQQTERTALIASLVLAALVLASVAVATAWLISRALRPVSDMTAAAAAWSEHDLDRRFGLGPPHDDLTRLAAMLDGLLERLAASLRREQRLTAELAHELRTPLAHIAAEAQYGLRHQPQADPQRAGLQQILTTAGQMSTTIETLLTAARSQSTARASSDARAGVQAAVIACQSVAESAGVRIEAADCPLPMRVTVETGMVERILAPLLENGCRYARHTLTVGLQRDNGRVLCVLTDDGPGISASPLETIFDPGHSDGGDDPSQARAGLGLALARRLARAAGGDITVASGPSGARFTVGLPAEPEIT